MVLPGFEPPSFSQKKRDIAQQPLLLVLIVEVWQYRRHRQGKNNGFSVNVGKFHDIYEDKKHATLSYSPDLLLLT